MNPALALSVVDAPYDHAIDQGREYYDGIVNFLDSGESHLIKLSGLEQELEKQGRELMIIKQDGTTKNDCERNAANCFF